MVTNTTQKAAEFKAAPKHTPRYREHLHNVDVALHDLLGALALIYLNVRPSNVTVDGVTTIKWMHQGDIIFEVSAENMAVEGGVKQLLTPFIQPIMALTYPEMVKEVLPVGDSKAVIRMDIPGHPNAKVLKPPVDPVRLERIWKLMDTVFDMIEDFDPKITSPNQEGVVSFKVKLGEREIYSLSGKNFELKAMRIGRLLKQVRPHIAKLRELKAHGHTIQKYEDEPKAEGESSGGARSAA